MLGLKPRVVDANVQIDIAGPLYCAYAAVLAVIGLATMRGDPRFGSFLIVTSIVIVLIGVDVWRKSSGSTSPKPEDIPEVCSD
jgi:hypothetical protein